MRGGQVQELPRPAFLLGKGVSGEEGGPAVGQRVEIAPPPPRRERGAKAPEATEDTTPRAPPTDDEGEMEVEEGFEPASEVEE